MDAIRDLEDLRAGTIKKIFRKEVVLVGMAITLLPPGTEVPKRIPGKEVIVSPSERPYTPIHHDHLPENPIQSGSPMIRSVITVSPSTATSIATSMTFVY